MQINGSIETSSGKSFTELEYDYAIQLGIPVLAYIADLSSSNVGIPLDSIDYDNKHLLERFIDKVKSSHAVSFFSSVEDLGKRIAHDVPAELEKLSFIDSLPISENELSEENISDETLQDGANKFERFWLRPQRMAGQIVPIRLRINKKFSGWKVKDDLIRAVGLTVGDCITTEVTVQLGNNLIDDDGDTDLFADGNGADWLLDQVTNAGIVEGSIIDCLVRLVYCRAPVGANGKLINKASLTFVRGIRYVGVDRNYLMSSTENDSKATDLAGLLSLLRQ